MSDKTELEKLKKYTKSLLFCYGSYSERAAVWERITELEEEQDNE
jgi:hypothetical protein|tara:strand:+ start:330 stop:464 length:135 start_codon:yes stop_codon:yes gene_type:complete